MAQNWYYDGNGVRVETSRQMTVNRALSYIRVHLKSAGKVRLFRAGTLAKIRFSGRPARGLNYPRKVTA